MEKGKKFELSRVVFNLYINSSSFSGYKKAITDLSLEVGYSVGLLQDLKLQYYNSGLATEDEKKLYERVRIRNCSNYVDLIDSLLGLSDDEVYEYLIENKIFLSKFKLFCKRYMDSFGVCDDIIHMVDGYSKFCERRKAEMQVQAYNKQYEESHGLFNLMISSGCYKKSMFIENYYQCYNMTKYDFKKYVHNCENFIKKHFPCDYLRYNYEFERNREIFYKKNKDKIDKFIAEKLSTADPVDFYLMVGLSYQELEDISDYIDVNSWSKIRILLNAVTSKFCSYISYLNIGDEVILCDKISISNVEITDADRKIIFDFMKYYRIPNVFYVTTIKKYLNGELDEYLKEVKEKTLTLKLPSIDNV